MGTCSKYAISHIILRIIQSNKNYYRLETFLYRIMLSSLIVKILSEGTFSRVVAHVKVGLVVRSRLHRHEIMITILPFHF